MEQEPEEDEELPPLAPPSSCLSSMDYLSAMEPGVWADSPVTPEVTPLDEPAYELDMDAHDLTLI